MKEETKFAHAATVVLTTATKELEAVDETETTADSESSSETTIVSSTKLLSDDHSSLQIVREMDVLCGRGKMAFHHGESVFF